MDKISQEITMTITKGIQIDAFCVSKTFRKTARRRPIVVVSIVSPVRVELDLAVVELEVGSVIEAIIGIWLLSLPIRVTNI